MRHILAMTATWILSGSLLAAGCSGAPAPDVPATAGAAEPEFSPCFAGAVSPLVRPVRFEDLEDRWWEESRAPGARTAAHPVPRAGYFELPPP